jgi:hypothetical protein
LPFELWGVPLGPVDVDGRWEERCTVAGPVALGGVCVEVLEELLEPDVDELVADELLADELLADELVVDELLADELLSDELEDVDVVVVLVGGHAIRGTVTVQSAVDATGSAASPSIVNTVLAAAKTTTSFLLLNTVADLLPRCDARSP